MKEIIEINGIRLVARYEALTRTKWMEERGETGWWPVWNPAYNGKSAILGRRFDTEQEAMDALAAAIRRSNDGARVEVSHVNGIGIDFQIDERTANDNTIVRWQIRKQYCSEWEIVSERK